MNIRFIGYGNLAKSIIATWKKQHRITISTPNLAPKIDQNLMFCEQNQAYLDQQDLIVLAVKPKLIHTILNEIEAFVLPNTIIISLAAGITLHDMENKFPHLQIIRAMPNIAAEIGESATLILKNPLISENNHQKIENLFLELGSVDWVLEDNILDLGTILAGSGPAYVFYLLRAFQESAESLGMPSNICKKIVLQTFLGATYLAKNSNDSLLNLQKQVTSPQGTTEAALKIFSDLHLDQSIQKALEAAWQRIQTLRDQTSRSTDN